ncbi:hypothetical protein MBLNU459_g6904t1 [Dothideomycetes sp. NU459]
MVEHNHVDFDANVLRRSATKEDSKVIADDRKVPMTEKEADVASLWSESAGEADERDFKKKQIFKGWTLLWLAYQSTGVIYGDIGTSPLYVYSSTFTSEPSYDDLLGVLSIIIWTLTLIVTVKYVLIVLCADDEGEGGTFAIYTLLSRYSDIMKRDPRSYHAVKMERYMDDQMKPSNRSVRRWLEQSRIAHALLKILAVLGVSLIMADGIEVVRPDLGSSTIIGVTCAILILLFVLQPLGISKLASGFAPIVIVWLLFNLTFGIYNLAVHDYTVLKAFSPYFAGNYFVRNGADGWRSLGGILLCFTGVEALFADLGAFSKRAVQISWLCFSYPCLLLAYIGQAAFISRDPSAYSNPFFNTIPPGTFYPSLVISILAAIVASQALITSTFQLLSQVIHSSYFPHIKMIYTSTNFHGQVYIPMANWLMMVGTVVVTAAYSNTTRLGNAYGTCVVLVTFITTNLVTLVALIVWRTNPIIVFLIWLPFATLDGLYLSSALTKVPQGAWFTIMLAVILASFFGLWRFGKEKQWTCEAKATITLRNLIVPTASSTGTDSSRSDLANNTNQTYHLTAAHGGAQLTQIKGLGIFFDKSGTDATVPAVYEHFAAKFEAQMAVVVFLHLRALGIPHVHAEERYSVSRTALPHVYRMTLRHGYNDLVVTPDLGNLVYQELRAAIVRGHVVPRNVPDRVVSNRALDADQERDMGYVTLALTKQIGDDGPMQQQQPHEPVVGEEVATSSAATTARLMRLDEAFHTQTLFLVGKEQLRIQPHTSFVTKILLGMFLWVRENTRQKVAQLNVPVEKLVEIGFVGVI